MTIIKAVSIQKQLWVPNTLYTLFHFRFTTTFHGKVNHPPKLAGGRTEFKPESVLKCLYPPPSCCICLINFIA